jgi:2-polyprenyl-3-methyl-5-hydroxy-6-metoxy-1,4-benzoquinol methylase
VNGAARYVWEDLSEAREGAAERPEMAPYYNFVRHEVLNMIAEAPGAVLDVGCGAGATSEELKKRFPGAVVHGIELNEHAAAIAKTRLDRVLTANVETLDFSQAGFTRASIDLVLFPDVLEHLYDPWNLLKRIRPLLSDRAHILASIPNARNLWLINELVAGNWEYVPAGLLDVTHIRFFTKKTIEQLFGQTGYRIAAMGANLDGRIPAADIPAGAHTDISTDRLIVRQVSADDFLELRAIQFLVDAVPA